MDVKHSRIEPAEETLSEGSIQDLIHQEYEFYGKEIKPWVDMVEVSYGAIPDGLLNEIRNFVGHITVAAIETQDPLSFRKENIEDAHKHLRRVLLDCNKLMCIYQQDYIKEFNRKFKYYNISDVDDGNFLITLRELSLEADNAFQEAKRIESTGKNKADPERLGQVYERYCAAYNAYSKAVEYINGHFNGVLRVAHRHVVGKIVSVLGWVITVILAIVALIPR